MGKDIWPYPTALKNLSIIPAYGSLLEDIEAVRKDEVAEKVYERFGEFIKLINQTIRFYYFRHPPIKRPFNFRSTKSGKLYLNSSTNGAIFYRWYIRNVTDGKIRELPSQ